MEDKRVVVQAFELKPYPDEFILHEFIVFS